LRGDLTGAGQQSEPLRFAPVDEREGDDDRSNVDAKFPN
jgi:hypothetical protein